VTTAILTVAAVLAAAAAAAALVWSRLLVVTVRGGSMRPTLEIGDRVVVLRRPGRLSRRRDLVVVRSPATARDHDTRQLRLKRLVGRPGDRVPEAIRAALGWDATTRVPDGQILLLGDHPHSEDSKQWGFVPVDLVVGFVWRRLPPVP
jgi:signal peptidase I